MTKYITTGLTGIALLTAISSSVLADCNSWQTDPTSASYSELQNTNLDTIKECMSTCSTNYSLSDSATAVTPAVCMQNVSSVEYMFEFYQNTQNSSNVTIPVSSSGSGSSSMQATAPQSTPPQATFTTTAPTHNNSQANTSSNTVTQSTPAVTPSNSNSSNSNKHSNHIIKWL
jgi:hypothetical protein